MNKAVCTVGAGGLAIVAIIGSALAITLLDYLTGKYVSSFIQSLPNWATWISTVIWFAGVICVSRIFYCHCRTYWGER